MLSFPLASGGSAPLEQELYYIQEEWDGTTDSLHFTLPIGHPQRPAMTERLPLTDKEKREQEAKSIKLRPFEYMLSSVEVTAAKEHERYSRPPHSEMRFDYLDEWEYAQDVTYLRERKYDRYEGRL